MAVTGALYPRLLGPAWSQLSPSVQRVHSPGVGLRATGIFRVAHGEHWAAHLVARMLPLPGEGEAVEVILEVTPSRETEVWRRSIGRRTFLTTQASGPSGVLVERLGVLEFRFRLAAVNGGILYRQTGLKLSLGSISAPVPGWLGPVVAAEETPGHQGNSISVQVGVSLPWMGLLLCYSGRIEVEENVG